MSARVVAGALAAALVSLSVPAMAQTQPGLEIGPELYYYAYREPHFVAQTGPFAAANGSYTLKYGDGFATFNLIGGVGYLDYGSSGTGSTRGIWNFMGDLRVLGGQDVALSPSLVLSPYLGVGYRVLFDKAGGRSTTTGASGYDRLSQYLYLPVGVSLAVVSGAWTFRPSAEYDVFIHGIQSSYLSEVGSDNDITNRQTHGYGVRASLLAETGTPYGRLSVGPFARYWSVGRSKPATLLAGGAAVATAFEPANNTLEAGVRATLGF